jgi:hypothetical protein
VQRVRRGGIVAEPAACVDLRTKGDVSYNGTNSQGVAFETSLSELPWNWGARETRSGSAAVPQSVAVQPVGNSALDLIEAARDALQAAKKSGGRNWSQAFQKRETAKRMAENMRKKQAEHRGVAAG